MPYISDLLALLQILMIDLSMAGDNALAVGMAAAGLPPEKRRRAVLAGIVGATGLRILFAVFAVQLLRVTGLLVAGGLLLLWVSWKMWGELKLAKQRGASGHEKSDEGSPASGVERKSKTLLAAIGQIIAADVSMSLDNVLGVAGVARDHLGILVAGLALSVLLMGVASAFVARLVARHHWVGYLGLAVILYTAATMIADGIKPFL